MLIRQKCKWDMNMMLGFILNGDDEDKICVDRQSAYLVARVKTGGVGKGEVRRKDRAREPTKRSLNSDATLFPSIF